MKKHFEKIKSEGTCIHRLDEELIRRRRDELRCVGKREQTCGLLIEDMVFNLYIKQKLLELNIWMHFMHVLRHALDIREHYERKLERANNLYMELSAIMLQLEVREKELMKYVDKHFCHICALLVSCSHCARISSFNISSNKLQQN